jgi:hypothetical protein
MDTLTEQSNLRSNKVVASRTTSLGGPFASLRAQRTIVRFLQMASHHPTGFFGVGFARHFNHFRWIIAGLMKL